MSEDDRKERMQRIRVGLTGLAVVLLIALLATVVFSYFQKGQSPNTVAAQSNASDEPLSDLGLVPGTPENGAQGNGANATLANKN